MTRSTDSTVKEALEKGGEALFLKSVDTTALVTSIKRAIKFKNGQGKRKYERFEIKFPVEITVLRGELNLKVRALNISQGGMFVELVGGVPKCGEKLR